MRTLPKPKSLKFVFILAALLSIASGLSSGIFSVAGADARVREDASTGAVNQTRISRGLAVDPPGPWHDPICAGDRQRYTLGFTNTTHQTLTNVSLVDTLDSVCPGSCDVCQWSDNDWPYDDCSPGAIYDGRRTVRWFFPSVAPGQRIVVYLEVRLWTSVPEGVFENCLTVTSDQTSAETACSQVNVVLCPPVVTPAPTRFIGELRCYDSLPEEVLIHRIAAADFYGYTSDNADDSALLGVTSPPAPAGWNQPSFVPDSSWQAGMPVWWDQWSVPKWEPFSGASIVGLPDAQGLQESLDGTTHLIRRTFQLDAPQPGMRITSAMLQLWSDNKSDWWWQGVLVADDQESNNRQDEMFPGHIAAEGGTYLLAVQNSNDTQYMDNPQGTAFRLCATWARLEDLTVTPTPSITATPTATPTFTATATPQRVLLPLIMMGNHVD